MDKINKIVALIAAIGGFTISIGIRFIFITRDEFSLGLIILVIGLMIVILSVLVRDLGKDIAKELKR